MFCVQLIIEVIFEEIKGLVTYHYQKERESLIVDFVAFELNKFDKHNYSFQLAWRV